MPRPSEPVMNVPKSETFQRVPTAIKPLNPLLSAKHQYVLVRDKAIPFAVRWSFLVFIFTLPFEAVDFSSITGGSSVTKYFGLLFVLTLIVYYHPLQKNRTLPAASPALWCFLLYAGFVGFSVLRVPSELLGEVVQRLVTLIQLIVVFWISSDMLGDRKIAGSTLLVYAIASATLAVGIILQLPGFHAEAVDGRATALRENPNILGTHMAIAVVTVIGLLLNASYRRSVTKGLLIVLIPPMLIAMVSTGSRGATAAFILGCSVYLLPYRRSKRVLTAIMLAGVIIIIALYMIGSNPDFQARWEQSYYEGNLAQREMLFPTAVEMFYERPIFGWGAAQMGHELAFRTGGWDPQDTHNLLLHLLVEVGFIGTIPFLLGIWYCGRASFKVRHDQLGLLPIALMVVVVAANLSGNNIVWKPQWLVFALAIALVSRVTSGIRAIPVIVSGHPSALRK